MELQTVKIVEADAPNGFIIINAVDFDPQIHVRVEEGGDQHLPPADPGAVTTPPPAPGNSDDAVVMPDFASDAAGEYAVKVGLVPADFEGKVGSGQGGAFTKSDAERIFADKAKVGA